MSDLLKSFLKPLAVDYLIATNPKLIKEATRKVANILFILTYRNWELGQLTKLLSQFDYLSADEMCAKIESIIGPDQYLVIHTKLSSNAVRAKGFADRNRRDVQSIVLKWVSMANECEKPKEPH